MLISVNRQVNLVIFQQMTKLILEMTKLISQQKIKTAESTDPTIFILSLLQEISDPLTSHGISKLSQCLRLDLTNTLTGDIELLANLLQCAGMSVLQTET